MVFVVESEVNQTHRRGRDITRLRCFLKLTQNLKRAFAIPRDSLSVTEQSERIGVVVQSDGFFVFGNRAGQIAAHFQKLAEIVMGVIGIRVEIERFASLGDTFLVKSSKIIRDAEIDIDGYGEGIEFDRTFKFRNGTVEISDAFKDRITEPMMRGSVVGIERDRFFQLARPSFNSKRSSIGAFM